ncbi:hypothetical protein PS15m_000734 [Mucor circinelloides]
MAELQDGEYYQNYTLKSSLLTVCKFEDVLFNERLSVMSATKKKSASWKKRLNYNAWATKAAFEKEDDADDETLNR